MQILYGFNICHVDFAINADIEVSKPREAEIHKKINLHYSTGQNENWRDRSIVKIKIMDKQHYCL